MKLAIPKPGPMQDAAGNLTRPWLDFITTIASQAATGGDDAHVIASMGSASPSAVSQLANDSGYLANPASALTVNGPQTPIVLDAGANNRGHLQTIGTGHGDLELLSNLQFDGSNWMLDDTAQLGSRMSINTGPTAAQVIFSAAVGPNPAAVTNSIIFDLTTGAISITGLLSANAIATGAITAAGALGVSGTVPLGPYTVGGVPGSITFTQGICTAFVSPT